MKELRELKKGDYIQISNVDGLLKDKMSECLFGAFNLSKVRTYALLKSGKYYLVSDNCKTCKLLKIKVGKNKFISIRYKYIK